jgi:guanosine-3',5'-bis(diphosphate) 3'-pyrophosphohydrolase
MNRKIIKILSSENFLTSEKNLIKKAYLLAEKSHKEQKQVTGKDYVLHPIKVAYILYKRGFNFEIIIAGLLHDVVEDSGVKLKTLEKDFGKRVANLVDAMSFRINKKTGKKDIPGMYKRFINVLKKDPILVFIKSADMISNIPNMHVASHRNFIIEKSYPRLMMFYIPLLNSLGLEEETMMIKNEFNKYTRKKIKSVLFDYITKEEIKTIKERIDIIKCLKTIGF